tara:strand:- start:405720 stop:406151 length:432 start_codon:yes stop_codon:yes gene_type:complete
MKKNDIEVVWAILCGGSSVDSETNNISIYKVLEQITLTKGNGSVPTGPHLIPLQHEYVILLQRPDPVGKPKSYAMTMKLRGPDGEVVNEAPTPAHFESGKKRLRLRIQNASFPVTVPGEYRFEIWTEGEDTPRSSTPFVVIVK